MQKLIKSQAESYPLKTISDTIKMRTSINAKSTAADVNAQENMITEAMGKIMAVAEGYPELKANQNFLKLQFELTDTEDKIKAARRFYNTNVLALNNKIEMFPSNIIAQMFQFTKQEFFELDEDEAQAAKKAVQVKF